MTITEQIITIFAAVLGTMITRFTPFLLFSKNNPSKLIQKLGQYLPAAIMGMLVIYAVKDELLNLNYHTIYVIFASLIVIITYLLKRNSLLSIFSGTAVYILLVNFM